MNEHDFDCEDTKHIGTIGLAMAIINKARLIETVDADLAKNSNNFEITHGQGAMGIVLNFLGRTGFKGLSNVDSSLADYPLQVLMGIESDASAFSANALGATLDAISDYGATRMFTKLSALLITDKESVTVGHLDSTSIHVHRPAATERSDKDKQSDSTFIDDQRELAWLYGYSRDNRADLAQVNVLGMAVRSASCKRALPAFVSTFNGNVNDSKKMYEFVKHDLSKLREEYPNLQTMVADSAAANAEMVHALNSMGLSFITRLPDQRKDSRAAFEAFKGKKLDVIKYDPTGTGRLVELASAGTCIFKTEDGAMVPGHMIVVNNSALEQSKEATINKRAEVELKKVNAALEKMRTTPAKCQPDAQLNFQKLEKTLKYCKISEPEYREKWKYVQKGRPSQDTPKVFVGCEVIARASIDQEIVKAAVKQELLYVLVAVNTTMSDTEIYDTYHRQSDIEGVWKDMKCSSIKLDSFFVKKPERVQSLICLLSLSVLIARKIESAVREKLEQREATLLKANNKETSKPNYDSILLILQHIGIKNYGGPEARFTCSSIMKTKVFDLLNLLDDWLLEFYKLETYIRHFRKKKSSKRSCAALSTHPN